MQKDCMTHKQQSLEVETNLSLQGNKSDNGLINNLKALKNTIIDLKLPQDGDTITTHSSSSSSSRWQPSSDLWSTWSGDSWKTSSCTEQQIFLLQLFRDVMSVARN